VVQVEAHVGESILVTQRPGLVLDLREDADLDNRLCAPEDLDGEVAALIEIMLSRSAQTVTTTKYFLDKGADLHMAEVLYFEGAPQRVTDGAGIRGFAEKGSRDDRRKLVMNFWQV
jgi:enoyl-CoA hydratase/carnithine racemase